MTGEVTLRGKALGIGGLKEKLFAALRAGSKTDIIPKVNETIQAFEVFQLRFVVIQVYNESVSIQSFRTRIRVLVKIFTEGISIIDLFAKNLQFGLVKQSRVGRIIGRGKTVRVSDKTKDVKLHDKSKIGRLADRV